MRKLKWGLLLAFAAGVIGMSQAQKVQWGDELKGKAYMDIVHSDDKNVYTVDTDGSEAYVFRTLDKTANMKERFLKEATFTYDKKQSIYLEGFTLINGNYVFFASIFDKKTDNYELVASTYNGTTGNVVAKQKTLFKTTVDNRRRKGNFSVLASEDLTKVLIYHEAYYKQIDAEKRKYILLDDELSVFMEKEVDVDEFMPDNFLIDNDGSIFYSGFGANNKLFLGSYDVFKEYEHWREDITLEGLKGDESFLRGRLEINAKNELVLVGYFSGLDKSKGDKPRNWTRYLAGTYFVRLDNESKEQKAGRVSYFESKFLDEFKSDRQRRKGKAARMDDDYGTNLQVLDTDDGGVVMVGESFNYFYMSNNNGAVYAEYYTYGEIVTTSIDGDGKLRWADKINKKQRYYWNGALAYGGVFGLVFTSRGLKLWPLPYKTIRHFSFAAGLSDKELVILYNENPSNIQAISAGGANPKVKMMKNPVKAAVAMAKINIETGKRTVVDFKEAKDKRTLIPNEHYQYQQGDDLILYGKKGSKFKFGYVKF